MVPSWSKFTMRLLCGTHEAIYKTNGRLLYRISLLAPVVPGLYIKRSRNRSPMNPQPGNRVTGRIPKFLSVTRSTFRLSDSVSHRQALHGFQISQTHPNSQRSANLYGFRNQSHCHGCGPHCEGTGGNPIRD